MNITIKNQTIKNVFLLENKKNKFQLGGCDGCGEQKQVRKVKSGRQSNWQHVYLCRECMPTK